MTSGNYSVNTMAPFVHADMWYPGDVGRTASVSWSGEDTPKVPPVYEQVLTRNPLWFEGSSASFWVYKRKRVWTAHRQRGEHAFTKTWNHSDVPGSWLLNDYNGDGSWDLGGWGAPPQGSMWFNATGTSGWSSQDDYALVGKLGNRLKGNKDFHIGKILAEGNQTLSMIAETAVSVAKAYSFARKGNFREAYRSVFDHRRTMRSPFSQAEEAWRQRAKTAANNELKLMYGVLPLVGDVVAGAEYLAHTLNVPRQEVYKVHRTRQTENDPWAFYNAARPPDGWYAYAPQKSKIYTRKQIKLIVREVDPWQLSGLTDFASSVWEATPWSFVFDWFIPIGGWLESRGLLSAVSGTYVTSTKQGCEWSGVKSLNAHAAMGFLGPIGMRKGSFTRTIGGGYALPLPTFKPLNEVPSWRRAANAVALVTQQLLK